MFLVVSYSNYTERFYNRKYNTTSKEEAIKDIIQEGEVIINIIDL